jgi:hypothetical protein
MLIARVPLLGEPVQAMAPSNENHLGGIPIAHWAAGIQAAAPCAPRLVRDRGAGDARVFVMSPSPLVRLALVQRLSHVESPRLCITLSDTVIAVAADAYDLVVMGPYLSSVEQTRATDLQARHPRMGFIQIHDGSQRDGVSVVHMGQGTFGLTETVYSALLTSFPDTSTGGTDA